MIKYIPLLLCMSAPLSASDFDKSDFDKDVGYCSGLAASLAAANPNAPFVQNALTQLTELVKSNATTMDVENSRQTAQAYALLLEQTRGGVPDTENENLAIIVDIGLKSCKKIGVEVFAP